MFKRKRKPGQPIGTDLDWFIIPIRTIRVWGVLVHVFVALGAAAYFGRTKTRPSPQQRAEAEIASAAEQVKRAEAAGGNVRPGSHVAQARDLLQGARDAYSHKDWESAFRLAVESQSSARRALGGRGADEPGDASLISVEGDVSIQSAGHSAFDKARQRQSLFDGDFIKTGRTGSAEIMFTDGTLYTIRPGSLFEVRRPVSPNAGGSQVKMVSGTVNVYTSGSVSTVSTDAATAAIDRSSRVALDVESGEKT